MTTLQEQAKRSTRAVEVAERGMYYCATGAHRTRAPYTLRNGRRCCEPCSQMAIERSKRGGTR